MNKKITENDLYAKLRKEREELYKIIGKEGITDQKVRIDKYAVFVKRKCEQKGPKKVSTFSTRFHVVSNVFPKYQMLTF